MIVVISHDPFGRFSVTRRVEPTADTCTWCGGIRTRQGKNLNALFQYGTWPDDSNRIKWDRELFCSKPCHDSYYS